MHELSKTQDLSLVLQGGVEHSRMLLEMRDVGPAASEGGGGGARAAEKGGADATEQRRAQEAEARKAGGKSKRQDGRSKQEVSSMKAAFRALHGLPASTPLTMHADGTISLAQGGQQSQKTQVPQAQKTAGAGPQQWPWPPPPFPYHPGVPHPPPGPPPQAVMAPPPPAPPPPAPKPKIQCRDWVAGTCTRGASCRFAHA